MGIEYSVKPLARSAKRRRARPDVKVFLVKKVQKLQKTRKNTEKMEIFLILFLFWANKPAERLESTKVLTQSGCYLAARHFNVHDKAVEDLETTFPEGHVRMRCAIVVNGTIVRFIGGINRYSYHMPVWSAKANERYDRNHDD